MDIQLWNFCILFYFYKIIHVRVINAGCTLSHFSHIWLCMTVWTIGRQAPLSLRIFQARILEWVAMLSSRGSSQPRDQTTLSCFAGRFFTVWATSSLWVRWQFLVHRASKGGEVPIWPSTSHTAPPQENRWKRQWGREELTCWSINAVSVADAV